MWVTADGTVGARPGNMATAQRPAKVAKNVGNGQTAYSASGAGMSSVYDLPLGTTSR